MQRMVIAKLFLKGGFRTHNIARICLEEQIRQYDALALEDHSYEAAPEEATKGEELAHCFK